MYGTPNFAEAPPRRVPPKPELTAVISYAAVQRSRPASLAVPAGRSIARVVARALHARHAPALGDVLEGASVVEVQATSGDLELPAVRLVVAGD